MAQNGAHEGRAEATGRGRGQIWRETEQRAGNDSIKRIHRRANRLIALIADLTGRAARWRLRAERQRGWQSGQRRRRRVSLRQFAFDCASHGTLIVSLIPHSSQSTGALAPVVEIKVDDDQSDRESASSRQSPTASALPAHEPANAIKPVTSTQSEAPSSVASSSSPGETTKAAASGLNGFPFGSPYGSHLFPLQHR